MVEHFST